MPKAENIEPDPGPDGSPLSSPFAKLVIGGIVLSFILGIVFFLTIAQQRSGTLIPIDAAPPDYTQDAG